MAVSRVDVNAFVRDVQLHAIAVELDLVQPPLAWRQLADRR
jgi:hypothetical protein